jgi:hypothetical protein
MRVWLDDKRKEPEGWIRCFHASEVISLLEAGGVEEMSLDHDLGLNEPSGLTVLDWLEEQVMVHGFVPPLIRVHSANPSTAPVMRLVAKRIADFVGGKK